MPVELRLDHLVLAAPDLGAAVEVVEARLGVVPVPGGRHPDFGTRNSLMGLGPGRYLEIIAPDPEQEDFPGVRPFGIDALEAPRLVTWAVKEPDLEARFATARARGFDPGEILSGRRRRPDGVLLTWRLGIHSGFLAPGTHGVVPFLIDWGSSPHPSGGLPADCRLESLRGFHPDPDRMRAALTALDADLEVEAREEAGLEAVITGPRGPVRFS